MILIDAAVNPDAPQHPAARRWLENTLSGSTEVGLVGLSLLHKHMLDCAISKLDVAREQIAYMKLWLGIMIVTDLSLMSWLLGNFRSAEAVLIIADLLALVGISWASTDCINV